jgi:hypothetical protein
MHVMGRVVVVERVMVAVVEGVVGMLMRRLSKLKGSVLFRSCVQVVKVWIFTGVLVCLAMLDHADFET